ncbi:ATP-binding protein [Paraburkholderia rhizosphaerae]|uniref:DNA repair exonuclease SbcCD ATPase subunit n=1 Tax=Paraburkholderia rhizosphaerae TaxID=480658 RepID=A0A4R8L377_9BURK|nr:ATP-binding protein [Paraburkholderia rhizosphaerae]TDY37007.1 DNA repair exonuclease SbcCD ATPase subunit [Paraburkholderia rhizosphaerae]
MFHLQSLELLQWDYCQRITLPLDGSIITIAGPNGSGKTTLLDAMRTLLGLECSGGRNYKTYARHANADTTWLRATVDNRPRGRQISSRPFARNLLYADQVTLACRIERNSGDWQRRYLMVEGDASIEMLIDRPDKDWLGVENWRKRLEGAGLSRAIARVLALEQGQTDRLCEYSPKELLRLVFDVFGDQEVLDRYEEARKHQQELEKEVATAETELAYSRVQLAELDARVNLYRQYRGKLHERELLFTEVVPVLAWHEERQDTAARLCDLHRQRLHHAQMRRQRANDNLRLLQLKEQQRVAAERVGQIETEKTKGLVLLQQARDAEKPVEDLVKLGDELQNLAKVEGDAAELAELVRSLQQSKEQLGERWSLLENNRKEIQEELNGLKDGRRPPPPPEVGAFLKLLRSEHIFHHVMADVVEITDEHWRYAAEGVLRSARWVVVLEDATDEARVMELAEREHYRHYIVSELEEAPARPPSDSLLSILSFSAPAPVWLLKQLAQIRRVESTRLGVERGGEWITPNAYWRDMRGGRSVWVNPREHCFGVQALIARRELLQQQLVQLDEQLTGIAADQQTVNRQLAKALKASEGHSAAEELVKRSEEFEQARRQLPTLTQARILAGERWESLELDHKSAVQALANAAKDHRDLQSALAASARDGERQEREWDDRFNVQAMRAKSSSEMKKRFPPRWITGEKLQELRGKFDNARQAQLRMDAVEKELNEGQWETDSSVEGRQILMQATVSGQIGQLNDRKASNAAAGVAVSNARERYMDVLRATVRRYRKNIVELGSLAGVEVNADLPHLDNDDTVLRQAELKVSFNFDGKGQIGLNDGEASGGQQVIKSLILLVGLLKDDDMFGGFVFIDEPFAHLDVRNIQLVGHFLKSTRAQYVLTTPITHNVEVFEPADITLVTSKKPRESRWAPPIGVLQRRVEAV